MTTHYETLGVGENFSADELKKAYRRLASQHHPDKGGDTKQFQTIQTAYDTLSDPNRRRQYDMERQGGGTDGIQFQWHSHNGGHPNIDEIFRSFGFGNGDPFSQFRQQQPHQRRNKDLRIEIAIPLVTTLEDQRKVVSVQTTNGHRDTVEVHIPKGITNGTTIRYTDLGDNLFATIPRGDLYVQINVHNADNFIVTGIDLHTKVSVNCLTAITGGTTVVNSLDDKQFVLTIPPGTQPNTKFRIANQGLYQLNSNNRGHLYVEMMVTVPQNLPEDQLQILKSINTTQ
jgi:curved DNA-binding protein